MKKGKVIVFSVIGIMELLILIPLAMLFYSDTFGVGTTNWFYKHFDEIDYYEKWEWIILRLSKNDRKKLFGTPNINCCFPDGMCSIIKKIMENDGVLPRK